IWRAALIWGSPAMTCAPSSSGSRQPALACSQTTSSRSRGGRTRAGSPASYGIQTGSSSSSSSCRPEGRSSNSRAHSVDGRPDPIADSRPVPLTYPEPNDGGRIRHICLVRIESRSGLVGCGEAITGLPEASKTVALVVEEGLAPLLLGEDPRRIDELVART